MNWFYAVARRSIRDPNLAEDAVQEALIKVFKKAHTFQKQSKASTWLYSIITNACIDVLRKNQKNSADLDISIMQEVGTKSQIAQNTSKISVDLEESLHKLPVEQRMSIILVNVEGVSVEEAARILKTSPGTVKSRCSRGRKTLMEDLQKKGYQ